MKDYYEILGVSKNASDAEIKSSYRRLALKWHPDRNKSTDATEKFKEVTKAYEVLSDPEKKKSYDQFGHEAFTNAGSSSASQQNPYSYYSNFGGQNVNFDFGGSSDPFEIFEQFFGMGSPFSGSRRQARPAYQIHISFDEAVHGVEREIALEGKNKKIKIPAGVDDGTRIRFSDFDLVIQVGKHSYFERRGQDIYYEMSISYPQAVLGGEIEVPTIKGSVRLKIRPGTKAGTTVRLKDQGIPYPQSKQVGDQYVIYQIHIPEKVSGKVKKIIEELKKETEK